jgi:hypothetical protein
MAAVAAMAVVVLVAVAVAAGRWGAEDSAAAKTTRV